MKYLISFLLLFYFSIKVNAQSSWTDIRIVDSIPFDKDSCKLEQTIKQDNIKIEEWYGNYNEASKEYKALIIQKINKSDTTTLIRQYYAHDLFGFEDINNDGYLDFCGTYHSFYIVHFYDPITKSFHKQADAWLPMERKLIDKKRNIYCDSYGPIYGYHNNESVLYTFDGLKVKWLYNVVSFYDESLDRDSTKGTKLYRFEKNDYSKQIFVKDLYNTNMEEHYNIWWQRNYKSLLGIK